MSRLHALIFVAVEKAGGGLWSFELDAETSEPLRVDHIRSAGSGSAMWRDGGIVAEGRQHIRATEVLQAARKAWSETTAAEGAAP